MSSNTERQKFSTERIMLIIVSFLLVISIAYIGITSISKDTEESSTASTPLGTTSPAQPEQTPSDELTQEPPELTGEVDVTPTPRRLPEIPSPTPFIVSEDDVRAILDLAQPDYFDYFDEPDTWYGYDNECCAAYRIEDGHLIGKDYEPEEQYIYWSYTNRKSDNVYTEITTTNGDCTAKDSVGLVIRVQEDSTPSGYAFEVSCDGSWRLKLFRGIQASLDLFDWTPSEAINPGPFASNRLGIWGYMGKFYLFLNGHEIGEYFDQGYTYSNGYFAVYVRASLTFDLQATFDDFAFWHIPFIP